jgi:hypothetical protein
MAKPYGVERAVRLLTTKRKVRFMAAIDLTAARLRELLHYDPLIGRFTWRMSANPRLRVGSEAGAISDRGYRRIGIAGKYYKASRLAWLYMHGQWPAHAVDHINGVRSDDRFSNLRDVPLAVNTQNQRNPRQNNPTGMLGVRKTKHGYVSEIMTNGERTHLGSFRTAQEARTAYLSAKRLMHVGCTI